MRRKMGGRLCACLLTLRLLLAFAPAAAAADPAEDFIIPASEEEMREMTVAYAREMSQVVWKAPENMDFSRAVSWADGLNYEFGHVYHGLPYTSDKPMGNATLEEFASHVTDKLVYFGPTTWNELPGTDCGGQVRLAYGWAGVLCGKELEEMVFDPDAYGQTFGLLPVGGYDWSGYTRNSTTLASVLEPNGRSFMDECYAQLQMGDNLFVLMEGGGEHIILVTDTPNVVRDPDGAIVSAESTVPFLEISTTIFRGDYYRTNWREAEYSFEMLYNIGFIPMTMEGFRKAAEVPVFRTEQIDLSGELSFHDLMSGRVCSNYNIFSLTASISDAAGNEILSDTIYPASLRADLSGMGYAPELLSLPAGNYRYTLTAGIGFGSTKVIDSEISWKGAGDSVVFISDEGTGNGSSPEEALGNLSGYDGGTISSYENSALYRAANMLSGTGGTVVICDDVTLISGRCLERWAGVLSLCCVPGFESENTLILTSCYGGKDYRGNGAELILRHTAAQATDLELGMPTVWRDVDLRADYVMEGCPGYAPDATAFIDCGGKTTVFEDTVSVSASCNGEPLSKEDYASFFPDLLGGYFNLAEIGDSDLRVFGGTWGTVIGGGNEGFHCGGSRIEFGGSAEALTGICGGACSSGGSIAGDVDVSISGGSVSGKILLAGEGGNAIDGHSLRLSFSGAPDLSGLRLILAGASENAGSTVLDLSAFEGGAAAFPVPFNAADFSELRLLPTIAEEQGEAAETAEPEAEQEVPEEPERAEESIPETPEAEKDAKVSNYAIPAAICASCAAAGALLIALFGKRRKK